MMIEKENIDGGKGFDFGRTSEDYAKYRDIYPEKFYKYLIDRDICTEGQRVLDIGTGTGVLPRNMYKYGAKFTGIDIAPNQIEQAKLLAELGGMDIEFMASPAEKINFPAETFDAVTACQCFAYFNHAVLAPQISSVLKPGGRFAILYMAWLPYEDKIAAASEELVLKYSPSWNGCGETRRLIGVPSEYEKYFEVESREMFDLSVPFTRETWNGRMKSCRGIGASLSEEDVAKFEREHMALLESIAPSEFEILHYAAVTILQKK
ncbi:MAG: class I SAM-dependent methyltransferase [Acutalibacteraceae bacterium]